MAQLKDIMTELQKSSDPHAGTLLQKVGNEIKELDGHSVAKSWKVISSTTYKHIYEFTDAGVYAIPSDLVSSFDDLPGLLPSGSFALEVLPNGDDFVVQKIIKSNGLEYTRLVDKFHPQNNTQWFSNFNNYEDIVNDLHRQSLEACNIDGIYRCGSAGFASLSDLPAGCEKTFIMLVKRLDLNGRNNLQIIFCNDGKVFWRYSSRDGIGGRSEWKNITPQVRGKEESLFKSFGDVVIDLQKTSLESCNEEGIYRCASAGFASISDLPPGLTATSTMFVKRLDINGRYNQQIIFANNGQVFWRNSSRDGIGATMPWHNITPREVGDTGQTRWAALGDSITEGVYSTGEGFATLVTDKGYPYWVAKINGYDVTNYGKGGAGYVRQSPKDNKNAIQMAQSINFANYDLVTLAYGVNDWHYAQPIGSLETSTNGDGTMVGNMKATIEKILTDNPLIKIVVILPHNCSRYGSGTFETNWGYGHGDGDTSGTLKSVIDKIEEVADYYGIQTIDNVHNGIVNRKNINQFMLDGIHPKLDGYLPIAKYLAKQIQFE